MKYYLLALFLLSISCSSPQVNIETEINTSETETNSSKIEITNNEIDSAILKKRKKRYEISKKIDSLNQIGKTELQNAFIEKEQVSKFPSCDYSKVILYKLNGKGNHSGAKSVYRQRTQDYKELSSQEIHDFLKLINSKNSYGNSTAACHEPRIGLVFYNENGEPCSYLSLCLACNNIYTNPSLNFAAKLVPNHGFSINSRKKLHKIFEKWGFPDENFSPLFDDDEMYRKFMVKQGYTEEEIKKEIKIYKEEYGK